MYCSLINMAVASFTRFRPSLIPARRNSVRRCCLTVRGLMFKWLAISLLLHPWTSRRSTCWSRGVILISLRLIIGFSSAPSVQSWGRDPRTTGANGSPNVRLGIMAFRTMQLRLKLLLFFAVYWSFFMMGYRIGSRKRELLPKSCRFSLVFTAPGLALQWGQL